MQTEVKSHRRFDYVKYDGIAIGQQAVYKDMCQDLEKSISYLKPGRAQALALTALEECYMWIGKAIRDEQIERNGSAPLQEERTDS